MGGWKFERRWWHLRFGLKNFLVAISLFSLWFGWRVSTMRRVEGAVQKLEEAGCVLVYTSVFTPPEPISVTAAGGSNLTLFLGSGQVVAPTVPDRSYAARFLFGYRKSDLPDGIYLGGYVVLGNDGKPKPSGDTLVADLAPWIGRLPTVSDIDLSDTQVTGACCKSLALISHLRCLSFMDTAVDDDDLEEFALLKQVTYLDLYRTGWSKEGVAKLRERLPNCRISHESTETIE